MCIRDRLVLVTLVHLADSYAQLNSDTEAITATARGDLCLSLIHIYIDKHSPVIDSIEWDKGWSQSKTITVKAPDTESGLGQYAVTRTADRPAEWQDRNVFAKMCIRDRQLCGYS